MAWAAGHGLVLLGALLTFLPWAKFKSGSSAAYSLGFAGAIVSWTVVVLKSLGPPNASRAYINRALLDENAQYLILALTWFFQKRVSLALLPYATFSLFHALNFTRQTFLPNVKAGSPGAQQPGFPAQLSKMINNFSKAHYEQAMMVVAYVEVGLMVIVTVGALLVRNSFLAPLVLAHFLRFRFYVSAATRSAFLQINARIDSFTHSQSCPPPVKQGVDTVRSLIQRYADSVIAVPGAPGHPTPATANGQRTAPKTDATAGAAPAVDTQKTR